MVVPIFRCISLLLAFMSIALVEGRGGDFWPDKWQFKGFDEMQAAVRAG
jgi:hypothetical protein